MINILHLKKIKNTVSWTYVLEEINGEENVGMFHENELKNTNQTECTIQKVIKKLGNKLYVKGKDHIFLNSWIGKKIYNYIK